MDWSLLLVLVRLAHDRRIVGAVVFFVLVLFVLIIIRISGGIVLPTITKGLQSILVESASGRCEVMFLLLGCYPRGF